jgi:TetR/AcrR family transcriptional regulator, transcriptional repressor for nem operon
MYLCSIMEDTRRRILEENYRRIHQLGFQGTRTDKVVADMGITKGAFYHYFQGKTELGYAIVDELVSPQYTNLWKDFSEAGSHQDEILENTLKKYIHFVDNESVQWGCILNNLMQEMAPLDSGFQHRIERITHAMQQYIESGLKNGQRSGIFRVDVNPEQTAFFILATLQGAFSVGKATQNVFVFEMVIHQLVQFAQSLKR